MFYVRKTAKEPGAFDSRIKVLQEEYSNPEYYKLLKDFKKKGLEKFPALV